MIGGCGAGLGYLCDYRFALFIYAGGFFLPCFGADFGSGSGRFSLRDGHGDKSVCA